MPLFGKGLWGSLLCATWAERDQLQGGPSIPFPALREFYPWPRLRQVGSTRALPPDRAGLCLRSATRSDRSDPGATPSPWDTLPPPEKPRCLRCPSSRLSLYVLLELRASLGVHLAVSSSFRPFPPIFLFLPPSSHIIETLLVTLIPSRITTFI